MKLNKAGLDLIKSFEGLRLQAYDDLQPNKTITDISQVKGTLTIGYGHTKNVKVGQVITAEEAEKLLLSDLQTKINYVNNYIKFTINENQFAALVSFCFNCGERNLRNLVRNRTIPQIADAFLLYNKSKDHKTGKYIVLAGLNRRRKAERELFNTPTATTKKSNEDIAREVIKGKWGNNPYRKKALTDAGYNYTEIQKIVNKLVG